MPNGELNPTVYDVAARSGVSIATVSRVLRRPDEVRPETAAKVMDAVRDLGYVPSASARGLAGKRTQVIGLLLPGHQEGAPVADPGPATPPRIRDDRASAEQAAEEAGTGGPVNLYYDEVIRGAEGEASEQGFALLIAAGTASQRERLVGEIAGRVDGLVVLAATLGDELLARTASRVPVVLVADSSDEHDLDHVVVDNEEGMRALVAEVLRDGAVRQLAYLAGPEDSPDERDRHRGFARAVEDARADAETGARARADTGATTHATRTGTASLPTLETRILRGDFSVAGGRRVAEQLLAGADAGERIPDAIVCSNDQSALGVLQSLTAAGVDVPGRVRVSGFDGVEAGRFSTPRLTTVRQPMADLGRIAVRTLLRRLADPDAPRQRVMLPVEVLLRESAPPR
ncbi:LacI family DNA-binding transcriptional regulator [Schumannella sp. 10F1B-5-1]|uniref:LacI family DNA-binding transcriptional regulator n=1 Tax=Schumannella sp. 10F1B-5-1 TaxID=2590780 RepID=UPI001131D62C|nr:LacI family DNA-binding transcriptional regulator [Schumannella sp. 10F1B-5-1]TPW76850.1 LacI family transcriptional regulator [Schumannella sp. 10F1B-5-1]